MSESESPDLPATVEAELVESPRAFEPSPIALLSPDEFLRRVELAKLEIQRLQILKKEILVEGVDYGTIPGTERKDKDGNKVANDSLYQPGVQKLNQLYGYRAVYRVERLLGDGITTPPLGYLIECDLVDSGGNIRSTGLGESSIWEKKHRYRYASQECPHCKVEAIFRGKNRETKEPDGTYFCGSYKGGCGANFKTPDEIALIEAQAQMQENPDPFDMGNTLLKMAAKRAKEGATVDAHAASGLFSQDPGGDLPPADESRAAERHQGGAQTTAAPRRAPDEGAPDEGLASAAQVTLMRGKTKARLAKLNLKEDEADGFESVVAGVFSVAGYPQIPKARVTEALDEIDKLELLG